VTVGCTIPAAAPSVMSIQGRVLIGNDIMEYDAGRSQRTELKSVIDQTDLIPSTVRSYFP
jgi:hypothetical protein